MKNFFSKIRKSMVGDSDDEIPEEEGYVELDTSDGEGGTQKVIVRPFVLEDFSDVKPILDALRESNTIALINIKPLKNKDIVELKRAISKLKKTTSAIDGDVAGFGEDYLVAVPAFAEIHRSKGTTQEVKDEGDSEPEDEKDF